MDTPPPISPGQEASGYTENFHKMWQRLVWGWPVTQGDLGLVATPASKLLPGK